MAKIISLSSQLSQGFVGNTATTFALQRLGHQLWSIPTVLLSNHPAYEHYGGIRLKPSMLRPVIEGLDMNDFLEDVDAIITGYLPTEELAQFALEAVSLVKAVNPDALYLCDPVFGDDSETEQEGKLYIDEIAAKTIQYELIPLADIITPNRFELSWLSDMPVHNEEQAIEAINKLSPETILATSVPSSNALISNILKTKNGLFQTTHKKLDSQAHGTGDLLAALYLSEYCTTRDSQHSLAQAAAYVETLIEQSDGERELNLIGSQHIWTQAKPVSLTAKKQKTSSE